MSVVPDARTEAPSPLSVPHDQTVPLLPEVRALVRLAGPVVLAELGWMAMGVVDTFMVADLGPAAIGAVGVGSSLFLALAIFGMGLLLGLDTLVAQASGAGRLEDCHRWWFHGLALGFVVAAPVALPVVMATRNLHVFGLNEEVGALAGPYLRAVSWSLPPLLVYAASRRYLQGMSLVRPVTAALVSANIVNVVGNWILIHGHLGAPALGVVGSAYATVAARVYMALALVAFIVWHSRSQGTGLERAPRQIDRERIRQLLVLGVPAACQVTLEVGVFAAITALAGRLEPVSTAAHQIALNLWAVTFMVPLGISSAAAVMVGHAIGRGDPRGAQRAGWIALVLGGLFMLGCALCFLIARSWLVSLFTFDMRVIAIGATLLAIAAICQLFDGVQVVATGALRGLGETRSPMIWNLAVHWAFGLPLGYWLCFSAGWNVMGLWVGLSSGMVIVGLILIGIWRHRARGLTSVAVV